MRFKAWVIKNFINITRTFLKRVPQLCLIFINFCQTQFIENSYATRKVLSEALQNFTDVYPFQSQLIRPLLGVNTRAAWAVVCICITQIAQHHKLHAHLHSGRNGGLRVAFSLRNSRRVPRAQLFFLDRHFMEISRRLQRQAVSRVVMPSDRPAACLLYVL
jgi:hypothetical protein